MAHNSDTNPNRQAEQKWQADQDAQVPKQLKPYGRKQLLEATAKAVLTDRNKSYGNPEDNFRNIAEVWNWWFDERWKRYSESKKEIPDLGPFIITPLDVAHLNTLMKMARLKTNPTHMDSMVDAAGYQACAADFVPGIVAGMNLSDKGLAKAEDAVAQGASQNERVEAQEQDWQTYPNQFQMVPRKSYAYDATKWEPVGGNTLRLRPLTKDARECMPVMLTSRFTVVSP